MDGTHRLVISAELEKLQGVEAQRAQIALMVKDVKALKAAYDELAKAPKLPPTPKPPRQPKPPDPDPTKITLLDKVIKDLSKNTLADLTHATGLSASTLESLAGAAGITAAQLGPLLAVAGPVALALAGIGGAAAAMTAFMVDAGRRAISFEADLAEVAKTTELSGQGLRDMSAALLDMSQVPDIGKNAKELAEIAAVAGTMGIKGVAEIETFTATLARLASTSDVVGSTGAASFGKFLELTGTAVTESAKVGSAISALAASLPTTESAILETATKTAQAGASFGLAAEDALALGAAFSALDVPAELARSTTLRLGQTIHQAVLTGGKDLENLASIAGVSSKEMEAAFRESAGGSIELLLQGFNRIGAAKGNVTEALESIGLTGLRLGAVIPTLSERVDLLAQAMDDSREQFASPTQLFEEAARAAATTERQWETLGNRAAALSTTIGTDLIPAANGFITSLQGIMEIGEPAVTLVGKFGSALAGMISGAVLKDLGVLRGLMDIADVGIFDFLAGEADMNRIIQNVNGVALSLENLQTVIDEGDPQAMAQGLAELTEKGGTAAARATLLREKIEDLGQRIKETGDDSGTLAAQQAALTGEFNKANTEALQYKRAAGQLSGELDKLTKAEEAAAAAARDKAAEDEKKRKAAQEAAEAAERERKEWERLGASLTAQVLTPVEKARQAIDQANEALDRGVTSQTTWARIVGESEATIHSFEIATEDAAEAVRYLAQEVDQLEVPELSFGSPLEQLEGTGTPTFDVLAQFGIPDAGPLIDAAGGAASESESMIETGNKVADAFWSAADAAAQIGANLQGAEKDAFALITAGAEIGGAFANFAAAKRSGDEQAISDASEQVGATVAAVATSVLQNVAARLAGGGTSQFGGKLKSSQAGTGAAIGGAIGSAWGPAGQAVGTGVGMALGAMIQSSADSINVLLQSSVTEAHAIVQGSGNSLQPFGEDLAATVNGFISGFEAIVGELNLEGLGAELHVEGELITVTIQGLKKGFESADEALGYFFEKILQFNDGIAAEGSNLAGLMERVGGRAEIGGLEDLSEAIGLAEMLDNLNNGIKPETGQAIRAVRVENEHLMDVGRKYGLVLSDVVKLTNDRIKAELDGIRAQRDSFFGIQDFLGEIEALTGSMNAANQEVERADAASVARMKALEEEIAAMEAATAETDGIVAGTIADVGATIGETLGDSIADGAADAGRQGGRGLMDGFREGIKDGGGDGEGRGIPELGGGAELEDFRNEFGDTMYEIGEGVTTLETLREELEALQNAESVAGFTTQELIDVWTVGAGKSGLAVIGMLQSIRGESFLAEEAARIQADLQKIQLIGQIENLRLVLAAGELVSESMRALYESVLAGSEETLALLESGELTIGGNAAAGQRKQIREAVAGVFDDLRLLAESGSEDVAAFNRELQSFLETVADANRVGIDPTQAFADFTAKQVDAIMEPFADALAEAAGRSAASLDLEEVQTSSDAARAKLDALRDALLANGQPVDQLTDAYRDLETATRQQIAAVGTDFIASLQAMGAALPVAVTEAMARASFMATRAQLIQTAAELARAEAYEGSAADLGILVEAIRGMSYESTILAAGLALGSTEISDTAASLQAGTDAYRAAVEAAGTMADPSRMLSRLENGFERFLVSLADDVADAGADLLDAGKGFSATAREVTETAAAGAALIAETEALRSAWIETGLDVGILEDQIAGLGDGVAATIDEIGTGFIPSLEALGVALTPEEVAELARLERDLAVTRALSTIATLEANKALAGSIIDWQSLTDRLLAADGVTVDLDDSLKSMAASGRTANDELAQLAGDIEAKVRAFIAAAMGIEFGPFTEEARRLNDEIGEIRAKMHLLTPELREEFLEAIPFAVQGIVDKAFGMLSIDDSPAILGILQDFEDLGADVEQAFEELGLDPTVFEKFADELADASQAAFDDAAADLAGIDAALDPLRAFRDEALAILAAGAEFGLDLGQATADLTRRLEEMKAAALAPITDILEALRPGGAMSGVSPAEAFAASQAELERLLAGGVSSQEDAQKIADAFEKFLGAGGVAEEFLPGGAGSALLEQLRQQFGDQLEQIAGDAFQDIQLDNAAAQLELLQQQTDHMAQQAERDAAESARQQARWREEERWNASIMAAEREDARAAGVQRSDLLKVSRDAAAITADVVSAVDESAAASGKLMANLVARVDAIARRLEEMAAQNVGAARSGK